MFLYAKLVMRNLQGQSRLANLRNELRPGVFPKGLKQAYARIAKRIMDPQSTRYEDTVQLLNLVVCAKRTLKWFEVQGAVAIDLEVRNVDYEGRRFRVDAKDLCGSLIEVRHSGNVELVHATAQSFLVESGVVDAVIAELNLCRLCIRYLSFPCFTIDSYSKYVAELVEQGHYIFANYALVYWTDHLTTVVASEQSLTNSDKPQLLDDIQQLLAAQYDSRKTNQKFFTDKVELEFALWKQDEFLDQLVKVITVHRLKAHKDLPMIRSNMRMEENILNIRRSICRSRKLDEKYGDAIYYCSRLDCHRFSEGFSEHQSREDHEKKHDSMKCPIEGCIATFRGAGMYRNMDQHLKNIHDRSDDVFHPIGRPQTLGRKLRELIEYVDIYGLKEMLSKEKQPYRYQENEVSVESERPYKLFQGDGTYMDHANDGPAKQAWKLAVANPVEKLLQGLIEYTLSRTPTHRAGSLNRQHMLEIWSWLIVSRTASLITDAKGFMPRGKAIKAAIENGRPDILDILLERAMLIDRERPSKEKIRDLFITAARTGQLPCVELFVTKYDADPYQAWKGANINREIDLPPAHWQQKERYNHSAVYYVILNGDIEMLKHLLHLATDEQLELLFRRESREDLILLAGANGHSEIISTLNEPGSVDNKLIVDALLRALFYNLVRKGKREEAEELAPPLSGKYQTATAARS